MDIKLGSFVFFGSLRNRVCILSTEQGYFITWTSTWSDLQSSNNGTEFITIYDKI